MRIRGFGELSGEGTGRNVEAMVLEVARETPIAGDVRNRTAAERHRVGDMIARDKVAQFLLTHRGRCFCERCLGRAVGIDPSTGHRAATRIAGTDGFVREYGVCSQCGESRLVTHAVDPGTAPDFPGGDPGDSTH